MRTRTRASTWSCGSFRLLGTLQRHLRHDPRLSRTLSALRKPRLYPQTLCRRTHSARCHRLDRTRSHHYHRTTIISRAKQTRFPFLSLFPHSCNNSSRRPWRNRDSRTTSRPQTRHLSSQDQTHRDPRTPLKDCPTSPEMATNHYDAKAWVPTGRDGQSHTIRSIYLRRFDSPFLHSVLLHR